MHYILKETTDWGQHGNINGTYIFADKFKGRIAKAIGFIPRGSDSVKWFTNGMDIDTKNRTFIQVGKLSKQDTAILL